MKIAETAHKFRLGDILVSSWGYDQTNVDFYVVKEIRGKTGLTLCQIQKDVVPTDYFETYIVEPRKTENTHSVTYYPEPGKTIKVRAKNDYVKVGYGQYARKWCGKPQTETKYH